MAGLEGSTKRYIKYTIIIPIYIHHIEGILGYVGLNKISVTTFSFIVLVSVAYVEVRGQQLVLSFHHGSGIQTQVGHQAQMAGDFTGRTIFPIIRLRRQVLLPAEPSFQPSCHFSKLTLGNGFVNKSIFPASLASWVWIRRTPADAGWSYNCNPSAPKGALSGDQGDSHKVYRPANQACVRSRRSCLKQGEKARAYT